MHRACSAGNLDVYDSPFQLIGRLSAELWRSCRLVVDTGLHAKGWTVDQATAFMLKHTAMSEANADAEVKRYCTWPGQAWCVFFLLSFFLLSPLSLLSAPLSAIQTDLTPSLYSTTVAIKSANWSCVG